MLVQMERTPVYNHIPDLCLLGLGAAAVASAWLWPWTVVLPGWLRLVGGAFVVAAALVPIGLKGFKFAPHTLDY